MSTEAKAANPADDAIQWLGCGETYERLRDLYGKRFVCLGGPTTLYFKMDDGTDIRVPIGWWIVRGGEGAPFIASKPPTRSETHWTPPSVLADAALLLRRSDPEIAHKLDALIQSWPYLPPDEPGACHARTVPQAYAAGWGDAENHAETTGTRVAKVIEGVEGPCKHHPGTDEHYHCVTCGCPVWLEEGTEHECPPGFDGVPRAVVGTTCCEKARKGLVCEHLRDELIAGVGALLNEGKPFSVARDYVLARLDGIREPTEATTTESKDDDHE